MEIMKHMLTNTKCGSAASYFMYFSSLSAVAGTNKITTLSAGTPHRVQIRILVNYKVNMSHGTITHFTPLRAIYYSIIFPWFISYARTLGKFALSLSSRRCDG